MGAALAAAPGGTRVAWFGPPMSVASMATARLMETWAHGQDVAEALGAAHPARSRLRHVATGPDADRWLDIAQAFAGPPGAGREPL